MYGYKSTLLIIAPNLKFLKLLKENENILYINKVGDTFFHTYDINYLEITRDTSQRTKIEAEKKILQLSRLQRMKWSKNNFENLSKESPRCELGLTYIISHAISERYFISSF